MGLRHGQGKGYRASLEHCTHRDRDGSQKGQLASSSSSVSIYSRGCIIPGVGKEQGTAGGVLAGEGWICSGEGFPGKLSQGLYPWMVLSHSQNMSGEAGTLLPVLAVTRTHWFS